MLDKPNQEEQKAIISLASRKQIFNKFISYLRRNLNLVREVNDDLDINEIQIGQGKAKLLNNLIKILEDSSKDE